MKKIKKIKKMYIDRRYGMEHLTYCQCALITCKTKQSNTVSEVTLRHINCTLKEKGKRAAGGFWWFFELDPI